MPQRKIYKSGNIDSAADEAERFPLFADLIHAPEPAKAEADPARADAQPVSAKETETEQREEPQAVSQKEPWQQTARQYLGRIDLVDPLLEWWNEEEFLRSKPEYQQEGGVIHKSDKINYGYLFGEPNTQGTLTHIEYSIGRGLGRDKGRFFLLAELVADDGHRMNEGPVGEYSHNILTEEALSVRGSGIIAAHRGKGAGKAFFKELMRRGEFTPEVFGYSPGGLATVKAAHKSLITEALAAGKPVPAEVLADYPDLAAGRESLLKKTHREEAESTVPGAGGQYLSSEQAAAELEAQKRQELQPAKEAWQMTREEFALSEVPPNHYGVVHPRKLDEARFLHRDLVEKALQRGKPVPDEVLADYPDLVERELLKKTPEAEAEQRSPVEEARARMNEIGEEIRRLNADRERASSDRLMEIDEEISRLREEELSLHVRLPSLIKGRQEPHTVTHPDPAIDGKPIIAETQDGRVVVPNVEPGREEQPALAEDFEALFDEAVAEMKAEAAPAQQKERRYVARQGWEGWGVFDTQWDEWARANEGDRKNAEVVAERLNNQAEQQSDKEAGINDRTLYLFGKAESGEEMTGAEYDELERGMRAQGLDDWAIQQQRDIYNSQRLRRRNTEAIMKAGGGVLRAPDGSLQIVHPSTKNPGQYQVSRFGNSGITGDSQFGSIEDAVRFAQGTGHTELVSGEAANDALIQAIEAESSRGAQQPEPRAVSHPDPAIDGKHVMAETQDGRVIEAMASHEKPPRGIQGFERPGGEQSQSAQKQPWQMTRTEYYLRENGPIVAAIQDAIRDGRRIEVRTQYRITPLRSPDHVRLTSRGEVQIREGKEWVRLFDSQIDNLARQAGMELPPYLDRRFHINYVEEALRAGKPVSPEVLGDYPGLQNRAEAEQIRENQPSGVESAGKEKKNDATATSIRSIRRSEVHRLEGGASEPFGRGDYGDSAQGVGGGGRDVWADGGGRSRPLGGEGADTERPEPGVKTEAEERPEYVDAADPSRTKTQPPSAARKPDNYEITNPDALVPSGKKSKLDANFAAIGLLKELQAEGRAPTREEQHILARFVGWGQFPALFNDINDAGEQLAEEREELKRLLGERDYERAKASTINAHYTAPKIVQKMWDVARRLGFKGGRVLEPGMGVGYFYGLMPRDLMAQSKLAGVELDPTSGAIARLLYPNASINIKGFQEVKIADGFYDLVITNVPFSENSPFDPEYRNLHAPLHDYYLIKSLDKVREGGLVIAITSSYTLDKGETRFRREMGKRGDLVAAFRLPDTAFKANAGTEVVTDLLIFRKRMAGEKAMGESASSDYLPAIDKLQAKEWKQSARQWLDVEGRLVVSDLADTLAALREAKESETDRIQLQCEWKGKEQPSDADIRSLRESGWYQESQNVWVTPLVKHGQSSDWRKLGELPDPDGGDPIPINNYYVRHPDHILGILDRKSKLYRSNEPHVSGTSDFDERFERAISSLPENIFGESQTQTTEPETVADAVLSNVVDGGYILRDGRILQRRGDSFIAADFTPDEEAKAKRLISVRDALNELNAAQLKGEDTAEPRHALNKAYNHFVLWHGPIRKATNAKLLAKDPSSYLLLALETSYDTKRQKATKADIFFKDTIARAREAKDVSTPAAAIAVNLFETGRVDINRIAEILKTTPEEAGKRLVADGLAYENPGGAWERAEEYLSGNVRKKLIEARAAADVDGKFAPNIEALEKVQPADVPMDQIAVKLGAGWIPPQDIRNFAGHLMQADPSGFYINYSEGAGWSVGWGSVNLSGSTLSREVYGTDRAGFMTVLDAALNDRPIKIFDRVDNESVLDKDASDAANEKLREVRDQFADWLWTDDERARRLHRYYNDNFNSLRVLEYTGAHYANEEGKYVLPGMNPEMSLRPNQIKDVWQAVANGKLLDASEVGAGKTYILGAIAMEWKRMGIARKPAIAVPKPRIAATVAELQLLYPAAKILSLEKSFDKENRKRTTAQMATGDYDMIVLSHEQLDKMPMSPEIVNEFIGAELEEIEARIADAGAEADDERAGNRIVKRLEKIKERVEAKLQEALDATNKDDVVYFEETGIDALLVDEAHAFKSLPVYSRRSEVKGVPSTRSDRATSMYMRTRWLMRQNNNKGVVFATGTPITNTLAEVFNMQRYLQPELLEERGIINFDAWANQFADVTTDFEYKASGAYEPVTRMTEFVNLPELQQMVRQVMATNFVDDMTWVTRPKKVENVITSLMTQDQVDYLQTIRERVERLKKMKPKERKESGENFLLISTDARKSALSPKLVNAGAADSGGKVEKVAEKVLEIHRERPEVTQMIFLDFGVNPNLWGYSVYDDIQNRLIASGIPKERIANFGRMSDGARQKAAEKLNTGEYLIGIGSSGKMGTGINAQKRLAAMHHVDAPWLPAFVEQRNGRGHRQGNKNDPTKPPEDQVVEAYYYTTEGSFDVVMWQALTRKSNFIREFMRGDMNVREMRFDDTGDEESGEMGPEMILAATSGNPYELDRVKLIKDVERLERQARNHRQQQSRYRTKIANGARERADIEERIERFNVDIAQYEATKGQEFSVTFNGKTYTDRKVAGNQLAIAIAEMKEGTSAVIGKYRGFDLHVVKDDKWHQQCLTKSGYRYYFNVDMEDPTGAFASADSNLRDPINKKARALADIEALDRDVETAKGEVDKPFKRAEELEEKKRKLREIQGKIEELYDQKPGKDVRKLAIRLESLEPIMSLVRSNTYDIAEVRQSMADVVQNKAAFDRWLLALQNSGIVRMYERENIEDRGDPELYVRNPQTGRYYSELRMEQGWEPKAANVPAITAFIEAEAQTKDHIDGYGLEEVALWEMAKSASLAQQAYGDLYAEQQAQAEGGVLKERSNDWQPKPVSQSSSFADIADNIRLRTSKSPARANLIYGNEQAHFWIDRADRHLYSDPSAFNGLNLSPDEARQLAIEIRSEKGLWEKDKGRFLTWLRPSEHALYRRADAQIDGLAKTFEDLANKYDRVIYIRGNRTFCEMRSTIYHELTHDAERRFHGSMDNWFRRAPHATRIAAELDRLAYRENDYVSETIAYLLGGQRWKLKLSLKEAVEFLDDYFANVSFRRGREATTAYKELHTAPEMRQTLREAKERYGPRTGIQGGSGGIPPSLPGDEGTGGERSLRETEPGEASLAGWGQEWLGGVSPGTGSQSAERRRGAGGVYYVGHEALNVNAASIAGKVIDATTEALSLGTFDQRNPSILVDIQPGNAATFYSPSENTIQSLQGRRKSTGELIAALQSIANIEAPDPSGKISLKELSGAVRDIARAAIAEAGGAEAIQDKEVGAALGKIASVGTTDQQGRLLSWQDQVDDAVKIARATIEEIESRTSARGVAISAAEIAQPRQPSPHGQGIGW